MSKDEDKAQGRGWSMLLVARRGWFSQKEAELIMRSARMPSAKGGLLCCCVLVELLLQRAARALA